MLKLESQTLLSKELAIRRSFVRPPEPPSSFLVNDPTNSIYVGRTKIFNVPLNWTFANLTNPHISITGITGSGKSIDRNEFVLIRRKNKVSKVRIGDFVDELIKNSPVISKVDDVEGISNADIDVYSFDNKLKSKWSKVLFAGRKSAPEKQYYFETASGRRVTTTGDHNFVILKNSMVQMAKSTEVNVGDYVPIPRKLDIECEIEDLNLISLLKNRPVYVYGANKLAEYCFKIAKSRVIDIRFDKYLRFYKQGRAIPIQYFYKLQEVQPNFELQNLKLSKRNSSQEFSIPAIIDKSKFSALFRLFGYIISEGTITQSYVIVSNTDEEVRNDIENCFNTLGISCYKDAHAIITGVSTFTYFIKELGINGKSHEKKLSDFVLTAPKKYLTEFLKGYFEGDGGLEHDEVTATTKSKELASDLSYSLLRYGIVCRIHERVKRATNSNHQGAIYYRIGISGLGQLKQFEKEINFVTQRKIKKLQLETSVNVKENTNVDLIPNIGCVFENVRAKNGIEKTAMMYAIKTGLRNPSRNYVSSFVSNIKDNQLNVDSEFLSLLSNSDLFWDKIVCKKEEDCNEKYVYDLSTENEVFMAGFGGLFVHNSYLVKTFLTRASLIWGTNALIIDWAGEYKEWVEYTKGKVVRLGRGDCINLLDLGGMSPQDRVKQVINSLGILTDLSNFPVQKRVTQQALEETYEEAGFDLSKKYKGEEKKKAPTLKDTVKILEKKYKKLKTGKEKDELADAIYRLKQFTQPGADFFAGQSTIDLDELTTSGLVDLDLSGLPDEVFRSLAGLSILQFIKEKMRDEGWSPTKGLKLFVVLDEAWKIAKEETSDAITIVREGRKYQFGLIVASQNPTDVNEAIFSNVGTTFVMRVKFEKYMDYLQRSLGYSNYIREEISRLGVGQAAVNMIFQHGGELKETFMLKKVDGEELLETVTIDFSEFMEGDVMAGSGSYGVEKKILFKRLKELGLEEIQVNELEDKFNRRGKHLDVLTFVNELERLGIGRPRVTEFLKEIGIDDATIIRVYSRVDLKKSGTSKVTELVVE